MDKLRQCYETLGVTPGASWDEIKQAYKDSVKVWHPDRFENDPRLKEKALEKIKEINAAYEKLSSIFREYGAPNFSSQNQHAQQSHEAPKDFESDPEEQEKSGIYEEDNYAEESQNLNTDTQTPFQGRPWRRYWARTLDTLLFSLPAGFIFGLLFPQFTANALKSGGELVIGVFILPFVILCEACILGGTGTTFGKWLLNIKLVRKMDGERINFPQALKRSFLVWVQGLAFGLPLVSLITMGFAAGRIRRNGTASWDDAISSDVRCGTLQSGKVFLAVLSIISLFIFYGILQSEKKYSPTSDSTPASSVYTPAPNRAQYNNEVNNYSKPNSVKFVVQDDCNDGISIQYRFFDVTNNLWWPSSDKVYTTSQYQIPNTHELSCSANANICFGATTYTASPTVYWGLGINNDQVTNIATSCVSCGSVSEKRLNFACPANNESVKQTQDNSPTNKKKYKSNIEVYEPPQPTRNSRATTDTTTTRQDYRAYNANNDGIRKPPPQEAKKPIEFSYLSPSQKQSLEFACFEARTKGQLQFNECIKTKLSAYK
jgi:hypothetical protein